ncbi:MAG: tetratricopeptide repeat protein [Planctomycetota bacterium]
MGPADAPTPAQPPVPGWFADCMILLIVCFVGVIVYSNTFSGEFVLDDNYQITANELLLQPRHAWKALTSDLWAFRGSAGETSSYYWRPTLVVWWMVNYQVFGLRSFGWHVSNILLHAVVMVLAYCVLRRLAVDRRLAAAILLIFAVHPAHVESVAWVSGSSDLLLAAGVLASLWCVVGALQRPSGLRWAAAVALYVPAVLSKESGVLYPALVFVAAWAMTPSGVGARRRFVDAVVKAVPFAVVAAAYMGARFLVLGLIGIGGNPHISLGNVILSVPTVLTFYLRQTLFPLWIGPAYPVRPVSLANIGLLNFVLPALIVAAAAVVAWRLARREPDRQIGLALWLLPLVPALNIGAFFAEHIVHDRYLYLSLLGAAMVAVPAAASGLRRFSGMTAKAADTACLAGVVVLCVPLALSTVRNNRDWRTDLDLAEAFVRSDPTSIINHTTLGLELHRAGRTQDAIASFDRAIELGFWYKTHVFRANALMDLGRLDEAETELRELIPRFEQNVTAYERLADCLVRQRRPAEAADVMRDAIQEHPRRRCGLTARLAVILELAGRRSEAVRELESVRGDVGVEYGPEAAMVLYQLGVIYAQMDREAEAVEALQEYLVMTEGFTDPPSRAARPEAQRLLGRLSASPTR